VIIAAIKALDYKQYTYPDVFYYCFCCASIICGSYTYYFQLPYYLINWC
jgi:hypothetical protein